MGYAPRISRIRISVISGAEPISEIFMLKVLYEDNHLIAVFKPAGILVQGDETGDKCLVDEVKEYLKEKYKKPGNVFLGLLHRLDRPVSGIVLFAKTSKGASRLSEQFRNHGVQKVYHALVEKAPKQKSGTLVHYLKKDEKQNYTTVFDEPTGDALKAELDYEVVDKNILKIHLKTGRSHQIRAQLAHIGCPIVGDTKYGARLRHAGYAGQVGSIALCATGLSFDTATTKEHKTISINYDPKNP